MSRPTQTASRQPAVTRIPERSTRQRRIIRDVFDSADRPLSIDEVLTAAQRGHEAVSLSTVYRFVRSLVEDGTLTVFEVSGQGAFYELAGKAHHHHFSCVKCGRVYELNDCVSIDSLAVPKGFRVVSHDLTLTGFCVKCNVGDSSRAGRPARRT